jgi:hypothetical protein
VLPGAASQEGMVSHMLGNMRAQFTCSVPGVVDVVLTSSFGVHIIGASG